jgi:hypothetical protein
MSLFMTAPEIHDDFLTGIIASAVTHGCRGAATLRSAIRAKILN